MRVKKNYMVLTFHSTSEAIATEKYCTERDIPGRLIPVPREISASCGLAWRMEPEEYSRFQAVLTAGGIEYEGAAELML